MDIMLLHDSHNEFYRTPSGPAPAGSNVLIRLHCDEATSVVLRTWMTEELCYTMLPTAEHVWEVAIPLPTTPGLFWYYFLIYRKDGRTIRYGNQPDKLGGIGVAYDHGEPESFQITLYDPAYKTPEAFHGANIYQIFPDRFRHAPTKAVDDRKDRYVHKNWDEELLGVGDLRGGKYQELDFYGGTLTGIQEKLPYLKDMGYAVTIVDGKNDQNTQTEQINTFLQQGVDVLVINPVQTTSAQTIVDTVSPSGTPIVFINREPDKSVLDSYADKCCYVGADARQSGTYQGELILDTETQGDINGDGKITYIMCKGDPENIDAQYRTEYSIKALTDAGKEVECLYEYLDNWDQTTAQQDVANALAQYGEKIEVVFCNNDAMALGALQSLQQAGRTVGKDVYLVGVDALSEAVQNVVDGNMTGTVLNDDVGQATAAAAATKLYVEGSKVEQYYWVDYVKVTKENAAQYIK